MAKTVTVGVGIFRVAISAQNGAVVIRGPWLKGPRRPIRIAGADARRLAMALLKVATVAKGQTP